MWLPQGQVLVFFEEVGMRNPPTPSFRLDLAQLSYSGLPFLESLLQAAKFDPLHNPKPQYPGSNRPSPLQHIKRRSLNLLPMVKSFSPLKMPQLDHVADTDPSNKRQAWNEKRRTWMASDNRFSQFLQQGNVSPELLKDEVEVTHELWFPVVGNAGRKQAHHHKLAIRNVLAMLHGKPVVGNNFVDLLINVQDVLNIFSSSPTMKVCDPIKRIFDYLVTIRFDDVRDDPEAAFNIMAWSELPSVQWREGYQEAFVHAAGMLTPQMFATQAFKKLSQMTKTNLQNASTTLNLVVKEAEERLKSFGFSVMLTVNGKMTHSSAKKAFDAFSEFLVIFYEAEYGSWPPNHGNTQGHPSTGSWLTRNVVRRLQEDFGVLYDYLVDTDLYWDRLRAVYRREFEIVSRTQSRDSNFQADLGKLPVTDILVAFDDRHKLAHIPNPYPLLPVNEKPIKAKATTFGFFSSFRKTSTALEDERSKLAVSMAYNDATNSKMPINSHKGKPRSQSMPSIAPADQQDNVLLSAFQDHERDTILSDCTLQEARLGRWILLYGILQTLSQLSVDVASLKHTEGVKYFLCASLANCPPWRSSFESKEQAATQHGSHCWTTFDRMAEAQRYQNQSHHASSHRQSRSSLSTMTKALPSIPSTAQRPSWQTVPETMEGSLPPASPTLVNGMYDHNNTGSQHRRVTSTETTGSQWTDADITDSLRPSMSTIREGSMNEASASVATIMPIHRGVLTNIPRTPNKDQQGVKRRSSGFLEHLDDEQSRAGRSEE